MGTRDRMAWFWFWLALMVTYPPAVEQWRPAVAERFPDNTVDTTLCVIGAESDGAEDAAFDEWVYWWSQHSDTPRTADYPRPPRDTLLGAGGDSRWSVGPFQVNVGNLAGNRIAGLVGWVPPVQPPDWRWEWPPAPDVGFTIEQAHMILLVGVNNIDAGHRVWVGQNRSFLPAWTADMTKCGLT